MLTRKLYSLRFCVCAGLLLLGGCAESVVRQYTELGKWSHPTGSPTVLSGTPQADKAAYQASEEFISQANWRVLEKIAPRPIWERLNLAKKQHDDRDAARADQTPSVPQNAPELTKLGKPPLADNLSITKRSDGQLRIVYPLQHFGGVTTTSTVDGGTQRRTITVKKVDLGPLVAMINDQIKEQGHCKALPSQNSIVITCDPSAKDDVLQLLHDIDRPPKQVEITARIFEVKHDFDFEFGARTIIDHLSSDNSQSLAGTFSTNAFLNSLDNPTLGSFASQGATLRIFQVFGNSGLTLDATFDAMADTGLIREVASPRMTVMAGQTGTMLAGQEVPINSARFSTNTIITEKTTYRPIGVQLYVTPQTIGNGNVKLHVLTVVSSIAGFNPRISLIGSDSLQNLTNPIFNSREAQTTVTVPDSSTLVIGGLRTIRHITRERKIPGLGDIWLLEWLFKNHRSQRELSDLYFFITPHIIQNNAL